MKTSNVSFENLLDQLSEEKINRVVDRDAVRAGWLDALGLGGSGDSSGTGSDNHTNNGNSKSSDENDSGGICLCIV